MTAFYSDKSIYPDKVFCDIDKDGREELILNFAPFNSLWFFKYDKGEIILLGNPDKIPPYAFEDIDVTHAIICKPPIDIAEFDNVASMPKFDFFSDPDGNVYIAGISYLPGGTRAFVKKVELDGNMPKMTHTYRWGIFDKRKENEKGDGLLKETRYCKVVYTNQKDDIYEYVDVDKSEIADFLSKLK